MTYKIDTRTSRSSPLTSGSRGGISGAFATTGPQDAPLGHARALTTCQPSGRPALALGLPNT
jgi:hypothetical protein